MMALERESKGFDPSVYLELGNLAIPEQRNWQMTDAIFLNKFDDKVPGKFIMTESCLQFKVDRSKNYRLEADMYDMTIDYLDIVSVSRLQVPNEDAIFNEDEFYVKNYTYNYMIQVEVSAINGLSVVTPQKFEEKDWKVKGAEIDAEKAIVSRSNISLANIFFKVSHLG